MNITILGLFSSAMLSHSPLFAGNQIKTFDSNFQKFFSPIFYNQQTLYLQRILFYRGLNSAVHNSIADNNKNHYDLIQNTIYNSSYDKYKDFFTGNEYYSLSMINCEFISIDISKNTEDKSAIFIKSESLTVYITKCFFTLCKNLDGTIYIEARSSEITHCCFSKCTGTNQQGILCCKLKHNDDFLIFLYNTMADIRSNSQAGSCKNIECQIGDQYYRCNNITQCNAAGYFMESLRYLSFFMNTIVDVKSCCLFFNGFTTHPKKLDHVIFCSNNKQITEDDYKDDVLIYILTAESFNVTIIDSVLISNSNSLYKKHGDLYNYFYISNCIINEKFTSQSNTIQFVNCTKVPYNKTYIEVLPHYTYDDYCPGPEMEDNTSAYGCNIGQCMDENCEFTFSFSASLLPFKTIHYIELQTATFTPDITFSPSELFSKSDLFSFSSKFSLSEKFSKSDYFTFSVPFSPSEIITYTFSKSSPFTKSQEFSKSVDFTFSVPFSPSEIITYTFSKSSPFTKTQEFSQSNIFTKSNTFAPTPTQSDKNNIITYSVTLSQINVTVKTVIHSWSNHLANSYYECTNTNGEKSYCLTKSFSYNYFPYVIVSYSQSFVFSFFEQELKYKKELSGAAIIGIVCGSATVFFATIGFIFIFKNRQKFNEITDVLENSSDFNDQETVQTEVQVDENLMSKTTHNDDDWL